MKIRWLLLLAFILSACAPILSEDEGTATEPLAPGEDAGLSTEAVNVEQPIETQPPTTREPTEAEEPIQTEEFVCPTRISPENGLVLPYSANILTFTFIPVDAATTYLLNIETPADKLITFQVDNTLVERNLSTFTMPGENHWYVEVINENREVLFTSENFTFIEEELTCATLLTPANGFAVLAVGKIIISWEPAEGAETFILRFTLPTVMVGFNI